MTTRTFERSAALFAEGKKHLVGGVNSPVRSFRSVGGKPILMSHGRGSHIWDVDGNEYIDLVGSYGPMILGHGHENVLAALHAAVERGTSFGASTEPEIDLALLVKQAFPAIEKVRFVNSGTEAIMSTIRLARAYSGKDKLIKFSGCYHGHSDYLLAEAGSGLATLSNPGSAGVLSKVVEDTLIAPFNNIGAVEELLELHEGKIAAILVEPVAGNMGVVLPQADFLQGLRSLCDKFGVLLVFDEVMTGFRALFGGAQDFFGVKPDLTCLGKVIGGGLPVGAYGGSAEIMDWVSPIGPVYQAGTLSGNPLAMAGGIATLQVLNGSEPSVYPSLIKATERLKLVMEESAVDKGLAIQVNTYGSMITPFFTDKEVVDFASASESDVKIFNSFFWQLVANGIYIPPSQFEAWFIPTTLVGEELDTCCDRIQSAFRAI